MFHRRSQPKFPGTFKMVDFQSFFSATGFESGVMGHLRARHSQPAGCGTFSPGLIMSNKVVLAQR